MNPTCRQSRPASPFPPVPQLFSWKNPVTGLQVQRSFILVCCHGPKEVHTEWCNISYRCLLPPSHRPFIIISPSFSLPSAISLDWIAPWPRAPVTMWCCILSPAPSPPRHPLSTALPLTPIPPEWKWSDWCPATLYHSAAVPLQLVASVMPYSQINQSDPRCAYWSLSPEPWKHIYKLQIGSCLQRRGRDNASDYSQVITEIR